MFSVTRVYRSPLGALLIVSLASSAVIVCAQAHAQDYRLVDVTNAAGVANPDHAHFGCTWSDYDGDGWLDLYLANDDNNTLYRNNGEGAFTDVTRATGTGDPWLAMRNIWADYDRDGDLDLYSHNFGRSTLYQNNSNVFTDVNAESGAGLDMPTGTGVAWGDFDRDGWLDLHATGFPGGWNVLLHSNGDGTFTDIRAEAGLPLPANGMGNMWSDVDGDGDLDIAIAAVLSLGDSRFLYRNNGDMTFTDITREAGLIFESGASTSAMVLADYDNDLDLDMLVTEVELMSAKVLPNRFYLFQNTGDGSFIEATEAAGITPPTAPKGDNEFEFFDAAFADYDNDGDLDLYVGVKEGPNLFFRNSGDGTFVEIGSFLNVDFPGYLKGMAWGDYDNDGDLDLYVLQRNEGANGAEPGFLLQNSGGANNWVQIDLRGTVSNLDAIGAQITVEADGLPTQLREVAGGTGFFDQHMRVAHFGLAAATSATVTIRWPNGFVQQSLVLSANQRHIILEPDPECPWDLDGDRIVGTNDLLALLGAWGDDPGGPPDFDGDGVVGTPDLVAMLGAWGKCR